MKVWPIITLVGLIYGASVSDSHNVGRESNPHPHRSSFDAEVAADFAQPHRVATIPFATLLALIQGSEWITPEGKKTTVGDDTADDGSDPGKKLFWSSIWPKNEGVPFPGWGDPDPMRDITYVSPPACSNCRPNEFVTFYYIIDDPTAPPNWSNVAADASVHIQTLSDELPFGMLQMFNDLVVSPGGACATALIGGVCFDPCTALTSFLPSCAPPPDPVISNPIGPIIGPVIGGAAPEPSTWILCIIGVGFLALFKRTAPHRRRASSPSPTKA